MEGPAQHMVGGLQREESAYVLSIINVAFPFFNRLPSFKKEKGSFRDGERGLRPLLYLCFKKKKKKIKFSSVFFFFLIKLSCPRAVEKSCYPLSPSDQV